MGRPAPVPWLLRRPAAAVVVGFGAAVAVGTVLLLLPVATEDGSSAPVVAALFTAVSAVCVTGLIVVDTPTYWSTFGELVILGLIQVGGIGIMTLATLLGLLIARRVGLRLQLTAQAETKSLGLGDVRQVVGAILALSVVIELVVAVPLTARFALFYGEEPGRAVYLGVFHAVSSFNNAGFALFTDNMIPFATDPWICLPIVLAVVLGGIGFPVLLELGRRIRTGSRRWSLHVRITVITYAVLLVVGVAAFLITEWRNPATLGPLGIGGKAVVGLFHGVMPRTAGFNSVDVGQLYPATLLVTDMLMFIGGGSAGTAGGIKVTTFALLAFVIAAEVRGEPTVHVLGRRLPAAVQRQALTVALLGVGLVTVSTVVLLSLTPFRLDDVLFEVVSAFGTVGLSTGITADLPPAGQLVLTALMFLGRLGPITLASALALRDRVRRYELPEERPIVG
ncbi:TrkH family potassium uptake protein [Pseudonocardia kunmingensis]|uniref:Potassium uptake TrkH family protein n=1 Tax=Pseudonocardia kunmingensis TaxID=630975 RepID=A0A543DX16_9PSEU|nr:potassium transporter TrkG [Pseudonocardia kunmingensis]TQM13874.1 potassium uptake TrkH family protein [Pseudonocardia kunmingensis]